MTSSHRYFKLAVGVFICSIYRSNLSNNAVADKSVDMEIMVDDFVTFYVAGRWH